MGVAIVIEQRKNQFNQLNGSSVGKHLDLSNAPTIGRNSSLSQQLTLAPNVHRQTGNQQREYLGINFECCKVYSRIFINEKKTQYAGNCPRCGKFIQFDIAPGGSDSRFFNVY